MSKCQNLAYQGSYIDTSLALATHDSPRFIKFKRYMIVHFYKFNILTGTDTQGHPIVMGVSQARIPGPECRHATHIGMSAPWALLFMERGTGDLEKY